MENIEETNVDDLMNELGIENTDDKSVDDLMDEIEAANNKEESIDDIVKPEDKNEPIDDGKTVSNKQGSKKDYDNYTKEELIEHLQKKDKRIADKDTFIGKRSSEIGDLRKQLASLEKSKNEIVDPSDDDAMEKPVESMKKIQENVIKRQQLESKINSLKFQDVTSGNLKIIENSLGADFDYDTNLTAAVEILKRDNAPADFIKQFTNNPGKFDTAVTFNIMKRAEATLKIAALEKHIEDLTKSKKSITDNFNKAGKKSISEIPATTGKDYSNIDVSKLSPKQIDALLEKLN